mgnify:FL=1
MSIVPPSDYPERVRLALDALPGTDADRARALGVDRSTILRWRTGEVAPSRPQALAEPLGVDVALLVYGPTARLRVMLAARAAEVGP